MEFFQILAECGDTDLITILGVVRAALNIVTFVIPIILIVLGIVDLSKAVVTSKEEEVKKAQKMFFQRVIYAVVIFLVPLIVSLLFRLLPSGVFGSNEAGYNWKDCWDAAADKTK